MMLLSHSITNLCLHGCRPCKLVCRVMWLPITLMGDLERHLSADPGDACATLVHTMGAAAMRGCAWAHRRLGQLLPDLPEELLPHVQLTRAELGMWPQLSDYAGWCAALRKRVRHSIAVASVLPLQHVAGK